MWPMLPETKKPHSDKWTSQDLAFESLPKTVLF